MAAAVVYLRRPSLPAPGSQAYEQVSRAFYHGLAALEVGLLDDARQQFTTATGLVPEEAAAWANLGLAQLRLGELDAAVMPVERAVVRAPPAPSAPLEASGRLADREFADIIHDVHARRWTGLITLNHLGVEKSVRVEDGQLVFASSSSRDDRLGDVLLRRGGITLDQYIAAGNAVTRNKRLGTVLVEQGALDPREMVKGLRRGKVSACAVIMGGTLGARAGIGKARDLLRAQKECCTAARNNITRTPNST